jgi:DNA replication protein DnaC
VPGTFILISQRYEKGSLIITSNKTFDEWGNIFWDSILASAILDRIVHHCHLVLIKGESFRMKEQKEKLDKH